MPRLPRTCPLHRPRLCEGLSGAGRQGTLTPPAHGHYPDQRETSVEDASLDAFDLQSSRHTQCILFDLRSFRFSAEPPTFQPQVSLQASSRPWSSPLGRPPFPTPPAPPPL